MTQVSMRKHVRFIINPISGTSKGVDYASKIESLIDTNRISYDIVFTKHRGHATVLSEEAKNKAYDYVIAIGGDGTINEVASALVGSDTGLGIIPRGSGNGLARTLGIPMNLESAISRLNDLRVRIIDVAYADDKAFFCTSGLGFDAYIGEMFEKASGRGFGTYIKESLLAFTHYKAKTYRLVLNGKKESCEAFTLTLANAGQYGNDAYISPEAKIDDGYLDLCIVKPFYWYQILGLGLKLFTQNMHKSGLVNILKLKELTIESDDFVKYHMDGEFKLSKKKEIKFSIKHKALNVLV